MRICQYNEECQGERTSSTAFLRALVAHPAGLTSRLRISGVFAQILHRQLTRIVCDFTSLQACGSPGTRAESARWPIRYYCAPEHERLASAAAAAALAALTQNSSGACAAIMAEPEARVLLAYPLVVGCASIAAVKQETEAVLQVRGCRSLRTAAFGQSFAVFPSPGSAALCWPVACYLPACSVPGGSTSVHRCLCTAH